MKKLALIPISLLLFAGCSKAPEETTQAPPEVQSPITTTEMKTAPESGDKIATLTTNKGTINILLFTEEAPETTKNFIELAKQGKYDDTIFHRVIDNFMSQGGDFENRNGTGGYSYKGPGNYLQDEFGEGLTHIRGAVSMANAGPNTGGSQFFIVNAPEGTAWLNGAHAIFGFVYEGMDVVDAIAKVNKSSMDRPNEDMVIEKVEISQFK